MSKIIVAKIIHGDRVGKSGKITPAVCAAVFDSDGHKLLLTRRTDNGKWCLPGGAMDPGESAKEACAREVLEETGLEVSVGRLIGVYSSPDWLVEYADGNLIQGVTLSFEASTIDPRPQASDETTEVGYFTLEQTKTVDLVGPFHEIIADAFARQEPAFVR